MDGRGNESDNYLQYVWAHVSIFSYRTHAQIQTLVTVMRLMFLGLGTRKYTVVI
jgi:hypothetical protein